MAEIRISFDHFSKPRQAIQHFLNDMNIQSGKYIGTGAMNVQSLFTKNQLREGLIFGSSGKEKKESTSWLPWATASTRASLSPFSRQLGGGTHECWHPAPANNLFVGLLDNSFSGELSCRPEEKILCLFALWWNNRAVLAWSFYLFFSFSFSERTWKLPNCAAFERVEWDVYEVNLRSWRRKDNFRDQLRGVRWLSLSNLYIFVEKINYWKNYSTSISYKMLRTNALQNKL